MEFRFEVRFRFDACRLGFALMPRLRAFIVQRHSDDVPGGVAVSARDDRGCDHHIIEKVVVVSPPGTTADPSFRVECWIDALHELPVGVLQGADGATSGQCAEMLIGRTVVVAQCLNAGPAGAG